MIEILTSHVSESVIKSELINLRWNGPVLEMCYLEHVQQRFKGKVVGGNLRERWVPVPSVEPAKP